MMFATAFVYPFQLSEWSRRAVPDLHACSRVVGARYCQDFDFRFNLHQNSGIFDMNATDTLTLEKQ